ncbi:MAG: hypothetical protein QNK37_19750 [Acidobacteriota bacterium]|nr:hypothetical protein [Acidobacteriota bacterium]
MSSAKGFRKKLLKELDDALLEAGLAHPLALEDKVRRESYEEGFLEGRLEVLSEAWQEGKVTQWEFQEKAMIIHDILNDWDNDPGRFTWLINRSRKQRQTASQGEA